MEQANKQKYYNIISGIVISLSVALILGGIGWMAKIQVTVNKADLALREVERIEKEIKREQDVLRGKGKVYHTRITKNADSIKQIDKNLSRTDQRSIDFWKMFEMMKRYGK